MPNRPHHRSAAKPIFIRLVHFVPGILVLLALVTTIQCTIKKPEAPSWRTNLVVPLANRTWDMAELIRRADQDNLSTDSAGNPYFSYIQSLDTVILNGSFSIPDVSQSVAESLGIVHLDPMTGSNVQVNLGDYVALQAGAVPPISFDINEALPPLGEFVNATVESGTTEIRIDNDFGLDLDTVIITINDVMYGMQISSHIVPGGIPSGESYVYNVDLSGRTISNQLASLIHCHTPGAVSFSLSGKSLTCGAAMPGGLDVSAATANIPRIERAFGESIGISSAHQLQAGTLSNGLLRFNIANQTNLGITVTITLPDIRTLSAPLEITRQVTPNQIEQFTHNLTGNSIEPADQIMPQELTYQVEAVIDSTLTPVTVSAGDGLQVTVGIENADLGTVQGIIAPTSANFTDMQQDVVVPKGFDAVQLPSAQMILEVVNTVNIPGSFTLTLSGDNGQLKNLNGTILAGTQGSPVTTTIIDNAIASFVDPLPTQITINGSATFGDGLTSGSITATDFIFGRVTISSPLDLIVDSTTFDGGSTGSELGLDSNIVDGLKGARLITDFANHLPLGVGVEILLGGDSSTLYSSPEARFGPITIAAGVLNPDGTVASATLSHNELLLDSADLEILHYDTLWIGELITLLGTGGSTVKFRAGDSLSIRGHIEIEYGFDSNLWGDE